MYYPARDDVRLRLKFTGYLERFENTNLHDSARFA